MSPARTHVILLQLLLQKQTNKQTKTLPKLQILIIQLQQL
jgi:hypothetical protein